MTDADMIEAISSAYGPQSKTTQKSRVVSSQVAEESGTRVARWGDADYSVVYRSSYASGFRMIVTSLRLDGLARTAEARASGWTNSMLPNPKSRGRKRRPMILAPLKRKRASRTRQAFVLEGFSCSVEVGGSND